MSDPVLSDEEKDALLDGLSSGAVEVHSSSGPAYAEVLPFEIGPLSRIQTDSYPRLQSLYRQFAGRIDKLVEQLLNAESDVVFDHLRTMTFNDFRGQIEGLSMLIEFSTSPLDGPALINLDADVVELLVETFYGGDSDDPIRKEADFFTPGEISVAMLFVNVVLGVTADVWQALDKFSFEIRTSYLSSGVIECVDAGDELIVAEFVLRVGDKRHPFQILLPKTTFGPLLPVFDGQKRERDAAKDAFWRQALRKRVVDADIDVTSDVGTTNLKLADVAEFAPGDVIPINNPQLGTLFAAAVPVVEGRFGVNDGRYAIEARRWLDPDQTNQR